MKRPIAFMAGAGILLSGCTFSTEPEGIRATAGRRPSAIEILQADVGRDIIPRLGSFGLILVLAQEDKMDSSINLVVTRDTECASEFSFSRDEAGDRNIAVRLELFGSYLDLIDVRQLDGSAMYDGTIGHGDNVITTAADYRPDNTANSATILDFMQHNTNLACAVLKEPPAIIG